MFVTAIHRRAELAITHAKRCAMSVSLVIDNDVARITLDNPAKHNAFDDDIIELLITAFNDASNHESARVILLSANGKHFSAGADLNWMKRMGQLDYQENRLFAEFKALLLVVP